MIAETGKVYVRIHTTMTCGVSFVNSSQSVKPRIVSARLVEGVTREEWLALIVPLTVGIQPIEGGVQDVDEIRDYLADRLVEGILRTGVVIDHYVLPMHEIFMDYTVGTDEQRPPEPGDLTHTDIHRVCIDNKLRCSEKFVYGEEIREAFSDE